MALATSILPGLCGAAWVSRWAPRLYRAARSERETIREDSPIERAFRDEVFPRLKAAGYR